MENVSKCCGVNLEIMGTEEGTHWYSCNRCGKPSDPKTMPMTPQEKIKAYEEAIEEIRNCFFYVGSENTYLVNSRDILESILAKLDEKLKGV